MYAIPTNTLASPCPGLPRMAYLTDSMASGGAALRAVHSHTEIVEVQERVREEIARRGPLCSADLDIVEKVSWYWSDTRLSRAALEHMYFVGELGIHHKSGTLKYYDLIENCIPAEFLNQPEPFPSDFDYR